MADVTVRRDGALAYFEATRPGEGSPPAQSSSAA
jgi:hypothetical protein